MRTTSLAFLFLAACSSSAPPPAAAPEGTSEAEPPAGPSPATPAAGGDAEIVARVVQSGPIGDGDCVQCSHQILVEEHFSGDVETSTTPIWVHYEHCAGSPEPVRPADGVDPCSLDRGTLYVVTLRRGASPNFGNDPMILTARPRPPE